MLNVTNVKPSRRPSNHRRQNLGTPRVEVGQEFLYGYLFENFYLVVSVNFVVIVIFVDTIKLYFSVSCLSLFSMVLC